MVARWTLDDTSAGYVDLVGGRVLTAIGVPPTTAAGIIGDAALFGGAGALRTGSISGLGAGAGFALELWLYPEGGIGYIAAKDNQGALRDYVLYKAANDLIFAVWDAAGSAIELFVPYTVAQWVHVVVAVHTGTTGNVRMYKNGALAATGSRDSFRNVCPDFGIGGQGNNGNIPLPAGSRVDEPGVWQFGASGDPGAAFWLARHNSGAGVRL